jgi:GDPmannose 4,6-dehydratase
MADTSRLERLGVKGDVELVSLAPNDLRSVLKVVSGVQPQEIYNLAGQTSVGLSFEQPVECMESISTATLNLLEVIRYLGGGIRFFSAGSSECFGQTGDTPATEDTPLRPRSPYAVAKAAAYWQVATYREAYGMFACTGILANHESPLRPRRFVTQKIIAGVKAIKAGLARTIHPAGEPRYLARLGLGAGVCAGHGADAAGGAAERLSDCLGHHHLPASVCPGRVCGGGSGSGQPSRIS